MAKYGDVYKAGKGDLVEGTLAVGGNDYAKVLDVPDRVCHNLMVQVDDNDVVISIDGGDSDFVMIKGDSSAVLESLIIPAGVEVKAKNATEDENFADLIVAVW